MDHIQRLSTVGEVLDALGQLKLKQSEFYDMAWSRISQADAPSGGWILGFRVLAWMLGAKRPLTVPELQDALATRNGSCTAADHANYKPEADDLIDACAGFVLLQEETDELLFAHPTVKEYLDGIVSGQEDDRLRSCADMTRLVDNSRRSSGFLVELLRQASHTHGAAHHTARPNGEEDEEGEEEEEEGEGKGAQSGPAYDQIPLDEVKKDPPLSPVMLFFSRRE